MGFEEYRYAQEFRDVIRKMARKAVRDEVPSIKMGKVYSVDSGRQLAWILFPNQTVDNLVKVHCAADKIPTQTMDANFEELGYDAPGDIVRVWGKPGSLFILDYYSGFPIAQGLFVTTFTTPQVNTEYLITSGIKAIQAEVLAAGGGGGSGMRGAAGTARVAGAGGSGGNRSIKTFLVDDVGTEVLYVTCGAGGPGGAAVSVNDTPGIDGDSGGLSAVRTGTNGADPSQAVILATGGRFGKGGIAGGSDGGASPDHGHFVGGDGGDGNSAGGTGQDGASSPGAGAGGGSGGGLKTDNSQWDAGQGGIGGGGFNQRPAAGLAPGGDGPSGLENAVLSAGQAGSGGASDTAGPGGDGGNGARGSAGGGGAASANGSLSGAGGTGGDGYVIVTAYY